MLLGPIMVIAVLSSAFSALMKSYEGVDEFSVGYRVQNVEETMIEATKLAGEEAGILFYEYPEGEIEDIMANNELAGFVNITKEEYTVYTSEDYEVEGITLEYFMSKVMSEGINQALSVQNKSKLELPVEQLEYMPAIDSVDYYGIVYIIYFCWCGIVCAVGVLNNEKKYGIGRRFQVSNLSETQNFLGKFIPVVLTVAGGMGIAIGTTVVLYGIHWGKPLLSMVLVLLMIIAGAAFALMLYYITENIVITIILQFTIVWILGFLGGSFETYMFSSTPELLKELSPIYHTNRALVELSCMGESTYITSAIIYSLAITVICSMIAIFAGRIRKRGKV